MSNSNPISKHYPQIANFRLALTMFIKKHYNEIVISISFLVYVVIWSYISIMKLFALNASVYDLGFSMQNLWFVIHEVNSFHEFFSIFVTKGILFVLAPLYFFQSLPLLLVVQSIALGLGIFPIYGLAVHQLKNKNISMLISIAYLTYFPMAGINWFDFHFQMFFVILFLAAYFFYVTKHYITATLLFILSGLVRYPYYIFPLLFSFLIIIQNLTCKLNWYKKPNEMPTKYALVLFVFTLFLVISQFLFVGGAGGLSKDVASNGIDFNGKTIQNGLIIFFYMLFPLLFLPLLSRKWSLFMIPFAFLVFTSDSFPYNFPYIFQLQYPSAILPFVWIGLIDVLSKIETRLKMKRPIYKVKSKNRNIPFALNEKINRIIVAMIVFLIIVSAVFFEPYGPLNGVSEDNFHMATEISVNESQLSILNKLINLIPSGNPYVYVQDNLPQAMLNHFSRYVMSFKIPSSVSDTNISLNEFPYYYGGSVKIDYVLGDVNNYLFYVGSPSMEQFVKQLYDSGYYRMIGEGYGIFLMGRVSLNSATFFKTYNISIHPTDQNQWSLHSSSEGNFSAISTINLFQSYSDYILPGYYKVIIDLTVPKITNHGDMTIQIVDSHHDVLGYDKLNLSSVINKVSFGFYVNVSNFLSELNLETFIQNCSESLLLDSIEFQQISDFVTYNPIPFPNNLSLAKNNSSSVVVTEGNVLINAKSDLNGNTYFWKEVSLGQRLNYQTAPPSFIIVSSFGIENNTVEEFIANLTNNYNYIIIYISPIAEIFKLDSNTAVQQTSAVSSLFPASLFDRYPFISQGKFDLVARNLTSNEVFWFGPGIFLPKGLYKLNFLMSSSDRLSNDSLSIDVFTSSPLSIIREVNLTGQRIGTPGTITVITMDFVLTHSMWGIQFRGMNTKWSGDLFFYGLVLTFL